MIDYSNGRALDARIAKEILHLEVIEGTETYLESRCDTPMVLPIPHYSTDPAVEKELMADLRRDGWTIEPVATGSLSQLGSVIRSGVGYSAQHPLRQWADHAIGVSSSAASAVMRAADLFNSLHSARSEVVSFHEELEPPCD